MESKRSFSPGRRWLLSINLLVAMLAVLAIGAMLNYLGAPPTAADDP